MSQQDYYDAITIHKYVHSKENREGAASAMQARATIIEMGHTLQTLFPGKPIWLSEWAVDCGENAISILGMTDTYLGLMDHPELFEVAAYFQINAADALIRYNKKTGVHTRTSYGAAFRILHDVFLDSEIYQSELTTTKLSEHVDAVSAKAVSKNGKLTILAVNKTIREVPLSILVDGNTPTAPQVHQALSFDDIHSLKEFGMQENVLSRIQNDKGGIMLPPLSINRIDFLSGKDLADAQ